MSLSVNGSGFHNLVPGNLSGPSEKKGPEIPDQSVNITQYTQNIILQKGNPSYKIINLKRIEGILKSISSFECGRAQLEQLVKACNKRGVKLSFVEDTEYGFNREYQSDNKVLYITLPREAQKEHIISVVSAKGGRLDLQVIDIGEVIKEKGGDKTLEGYIVGHELSHAMSFVMCIKENGEIDQNRLNKYDDYFLVLQDLGMLSCGDPDMEKSLKKYSKFLCQYLFFQGSPDDARNLFGLGIDDENNPIIGEYHYLKEIVGDKIRIPYNKLSILKLVGIDKLFDFDRLTFSEVLHQEGMDYGNKLFGFLCEEKGIKTIDVKKIKGDEIKKIEEVNKFTIIKSLRDCPDLTERLKSKVQELKGQDAGNLFEDERLKDCVINLIQAINVYHKPIPLFFEEMIAVKTGKNFLPCKIDVKNP